ncbi:MAG TPA: hypothetical protein VFT60_02545 [Bryobacteraceae bacterium]|nr:hypothetical protein [Bryobacteraceae bacterium]
MAPDRAALRRIPEAALWLLPVLFLLWLYRAAFHTWFLADDFAWLGLIHGVASTRDLLHALFAPAAQGTIRPWSERGFFIALESLFGLNQIPFRIVAFATAAGDALLIAWTVKKLTQSRAASILAPFFWIANTALVRPLSWSAAYNELMCPLFLLSALALLIRYIDTGRRRFWWVQFAIFILGFGALEINIVYPAIAAAWIILVQKADRRLLRGVAPLAALSAAYFALHRWVAPLPSSGPYALHFDSGIFTSLRLYSGWVVLPEPSIRMGMGHLLARSVLAVSAAALAACAVLAWRRRRAFFFGIAWFAITLAPLLPLSGHRSSYYLTIPSIGIAMFAAAGAAEFARNSAAQRTLAAGVILFWLLPVIRVTSREVRWWRDQSGKVRTLILGVQSARQAHPGKPIALEGISANLFNLSFVDRAFERLQIPDVYLTPQTVLAGTASSPAPFVLDMNVFHHAITHNEVVVYSFESDHLRNRTEGYRRQESGRHVDRLPSRVDVGNTLYSWLLGPEWLPPESGIRWMPRKATLRLGVPAAASRLELEGECPSAQLSAAPRTLMVLIDGKTVSNTRIYDSERIFHRLIRLPADMLAGKDSVEIGIQVVPVDRIDGQEYGLVFGRVGLLP